MLADHKQIDKRTTMMNQNRKCRLGTANNKITGGRRGGGLGVSTSLRSTNLALSSAVVPQTLSCSVCMEDS